MAALIAFLTSWFRDGDKPPALPPWPPTAPNKPPHVLTCGLSLAEVSPAWPARSLSVHAHYGVVGWHRAKQIATAPSKNDNQQQTTPAMAIYNESSNNASNASKLTRHMAPPPEEGDSPACRVRKDGFRRDELVLGVPCQHVFSMRRHVHAHEAQCRRPRDFHSHSHGAFVPKNTLERRQNACWSGIKKNKPSTLGGVMCSHKLRGELLGRQELQTGASG